VSSAGAPQRYAHVEETPPTSNKSECGNTLAVRPRSGFSFRLRICRSGRDEHLGEFPLSQCFHQLACFDAVGQVGDEAIVESTIKVPHPRLRTRHKVAAGRQASITAPARDRKRWFHGPAAFTRVRTYGTDCERLDPGISCCAPSRSTSNSCGKGKAGCTSEGTNCFWKSVSLLLAELDPFPCHLRQVQIIRGGYAGTATIG